MANSLTMSDEGREALKKHEAVINGLYDDPSGFATYGVGHLAQKHKSVLLETARSEKLCTSRIKDKHWGNGKKTPYLEREVIACDDFEQLQARASERAPDIVARSKFKKPLSELPDRHKIVAHAMGAQALAEELQLLTSTTDAVLKKDLGKFEQAVNEAVKVAVKQSEFDPLVSFTFNVGRAAFEGSTLLKKINENKYRTGDVTQRRKAIAEIEAAFLAWNKSGGVVLPGLVKRRKAEADAFLKAARAELKAMEAKLMGPPAPPPTVSPDLRLR